LNELVYHDHYIIEKRFFPIDLIIHPDQDNQ